MSVSWEAIIATREGVGGWGGGTTTMSRVEKQPYLHILLEILEIDISHRVSACSTGYHPYYEYKHGLLLSLIYLTLTEGFELANHVETSRLNRNGSSCPMRPFTLDW